MRLLFEIDKKDYEPNGAAFIRPSARAIIKRENKISMIYSKRRNYYKIPGGGIEQGEDNVTAMIREVKEEVGLIVIPETVKEFGYVHRIQKGKYEPIFIQDNYYYICDVDSQQIETEYSDNEKTEEFIPVWIDIAEAIKANEEYASTNSYDSMIERELRVLKLIQDAQI
jgi:8-oxo-dGTP pyrophosphatase MutT (NUDIX family)